DLNGVNAAFDKVTGNGVITNSKSNSPATLTVGNGGSSFSFSGSIHDSASAVALTKVGVGMLTLSGNNTYSGTTRISSGILRAGSSTAFSANGIFDATGATVDLAGFSATIAGLADESTGTYRNGTANTSAT